MSGPRVLLAPDKFKGSASADDVVAALARGLTAVRPDARIVRVPVADGGDGTVDAAVAAGFERVTVSVAGPTGRPVGTSYARRGGAAVIELADTCGLTRLPGGTPSPLEASSRGLGEAIAAALDAGCRDLVVGIGGSASTDGGAGMVAALGGVLRDSSGAPLPDGGAALADVAALDLSGLHPALGAAHVVVACDVDNPLTGPAGAAAVYGPQKGGSPADTALLDTALTRWADVVAASTGADHRDVPGAGAAGGVGFAAVSLLRAELRPGIDLVLDLVGFDDALVDTDLVVTGEGSLDPQSLHGKAPVGVARRAVAAGVQVVAVAGRNVLDRADLAAVGITGAYTLLELEPDVATCLASPLPLLERLGAEIAAQHLR